jgi:pimeloyl-ACP methyl ester carboxylesterase
MTIEPTHQWHELASGVELHTVRWDPVEATEQPWLLVHGLASNARLWDGVAAHLAARGHPVAAVDQRGHGLSSKPDVGYDMATVADDLHLLLDVLAGTDGWATDATSRPGVAGQSWGGNVVLELASRHPDSLAVISCVDGGFIDLQTRFPEWDDAALALAPPRLAGTPLSQMQGWLEASAGDWPEAGRQGTLANFEIRDDGTIAPWLTFDRHLMVLRGLWEHAPSMLYPIITTPVLMIVADTGDVAWTHSKQDAVDAAMNALTHGRAEWFRPAHHDVHAQHPDEVGDLLHRAIAEPDFFAQPSGPDGEADNDINDINDKDNS